MAASISVGSVHGYVCTTCCMKGSMAMAKMMTKAPREARCKPRNRKKEEQRIPGPAAGKIEPLEVS